MCAVSTQVESPSLIVPFTAFLASSDVNFIAVNWTDIDTIMYPLARYHVPAIGQRVPAYLPIPSPASMTT